MELNVLRYGAKGDGKVKDTHAIQEAINASNKSGGGMVCFPPGVYLSGTLHLKSNVTLYLSAGATLLGSDQKDDYEIGPDYVPSWIGSGALLRGDDAENISIEGRGTIDGRGGAFWSAPERGVEKEPLRLCNTRRKPKEYRPRALILLQNCSDVLVRDVTIKNSPCFTLWLVSCERANIDGVTILNPLDGPNSDGIDIDSCHDVRIANCHVTAGDDALALKSGVTPKCRLKSCENVAVANCTLHSYCCAVRIGYEGDAPLKNCVFSNLAIHDTNIGIGINVITPKIDVPGFKIDVPGFKIEGIDKGAEVENIIFSDIVMDNVNTAFFLWLGTEVSKTPEGKMENVSISNVIARANYSSFIGGLPDNTIKGVTLSNIKMIMQGKLVAADIHPGVPGIWARRRIPYGFYFRHVDNLRLHDVEVEWQDASGDWEHAVKCENVKNLEMDGFIGRQGALKTDVPAVLLSDVEKAFIRGCTASAGTGIFLSLAGITKDITVIGNDLSQAKKAFEISPGLEEKILYQAANHLPD